MQKDGKSGYIINSVINALNLFELFQNDVAAISPLETAQALRMQKNSASRLLSTLEQRNYLELDKLSGHYRLGFKTLELGQSYLKHAELRRLIDPVIKKIVQECHETTSLGILEKQHIVYTNALESPQMIRVTSRLGARFPAYCIASGKVQLAFLSEQELDAVYPEENFKTFTQKTHRCKTSLQQELQAVVKCGYAVDLEEIEAGVCCVAVPVRDYTQKIVGSLSVSGPSFRMTKKRIETEMAPFLLTTSNELSTALGYLIRPESR